MYIEVEFTNGTTGRYPVSETSTITIEDGTLAINKFAMQGVSSFELVHADLTPDIPAVEPVPDETVGTTGGKPDGDVEPAPTDSSVTSSVTDSDGNTTTTVTAPTDPADLPAPVETPIVAPDPPTTDETPDLSHDTAAANAASAVDASVQAVNDPATPSADALDIVKAAQADVQQALATWPDSAPLLDAANQLSQLEADLAPAA